MTKDENKMLPLDSIRAIKGDTLAVEVKRKSASLIININSQINDFIINTISKVIMVGDGEVVVKSGISVGDTVVVDGLNSNILGSGNVPVYATHTEKRVEKYYEIEGKIEVEKEREVEYDIGFAIIPLYNVVIILK